VAERLPETLRGYHEPLLVGGATAVAVMQRHPEAVFTLGSASAAVIGVWEAVRNETEALIAEVERHGERHSPEYFAAMRDALSASDDAGGGLRRAALYVYLRGTAAPDARGEPPVDLSSASPGRHALAFDEANLRAVGRLLRERDVGFEVRSLFESLPDVLDEDLVVLDPPAHEAVAPREGATTPGGAPSRELRSFVGTATAKGAAVLLLPPAAEGAEGDGAVSALSGWRDLDRVDEGFWGNRALRRMLAARE